MSNFKKEKKYLEKGEKVEEIYNLPELNDDAIKKDKYLNTKHTRDEINPLKIRKENNKLRHQNQSNRRNSNLNKNIEDDEFNINCIPLKNDLTQENNESINISLDFIDNVVNKTEDNNNNKFTPKKLPLMIPCFKNNYIGIPNFDSLCGLFINTEMDSSLKANKYVYSKGRQFEFIKRALESFKSDDEMIVLNSLCELSSDLSLASDSVANDSNCQNLIKELFLLFDKFNALPDISMSVLQCINYILDLNPMYTSTIIKYNGVTKIVKMTQNIEYIDCAEKAIKAIEKMSFENPYAMLENDAFQAVLIFIDFFDLNLRKSALKSCVNMTKSLRNMDYIKKFIFPAIPSLTNLTKYSGNSDLEKTILELAIQCFFNITYYLKLYNLSSLNFCNSIIQYGLLENIFELFVKFLKEDRKYSSVVQADTFKNILRIFEILCSISPEITNLVLNMNVLEIIYNILCKELEVGISVTSMNVKLSSSSSSAYIELFALLISFFPGKKSKSSDRILASNNEHFFIYFSDKILIFLINNIVNISSSTTMVSLIKLISMYIQNSPNDYIQKYMDPAKISNIASKMVDSKDSSYIVEIFDLVEIIMNKVPEIFFVSFIREGVVDHIKSLTEVEESQLYVSQEKLDDNINGKEKNIYGGVIMKDEVYDDDANDLDEFQNNKFKHIGKEQDIDNIANEDVNINKETTNNTYSYNNLANNSNTNVSQNKSVILNNLRKYKIIHKTYTDNKFKNKKDENKEVQAQTNSGHTNNSTPSPKKKAYTLCSSFIITKAIKDKSIELCEKFFKDEFISNLLFKTGSIINPKQILMKLNDIKVILKNSNEVDINILSELFNILIDKNKITFYEIETSQIFLYLAKYFDENFIINYEKTHEYKNETIAAVSGSYDKNIYNHLKIFFLALNNDVDKISEFIKIIQYCISSMNCFKLFLHDNPSIKNASHLFISSFKNQGYKIKLKFLYNPSDLGVKQLLNDENYSLKDLYEFCINKNLSASFEQTDTFLQMKDFIFKSVNVNKLEVSNLKKDNSSSVKDDYHEELFAQLRNRKGSEEDMQLTEKLLQKLIERKTSIEGNDCILNTNLSNINQNDKINQLDENTNFNLYTYKLDVNFFLLINGNRMDIVNEWTINDLFSEMKSFYKRADYYSISSDFQINFDIVYKSNYDETNINFNKLHELTDVNDGEELCLSLEKNKNLIKDRNYESVLFEKFYRDNIVNNRAVYCIKRASPFVYLISLMELSVNNFSSLFEFDFNKRILLPSELENLKMTSLLMKQVKDPYAISSSSIPSWCKEMCHSFTYLSGFNSRYLLFKISSFDAKRSMSNLYIYLKNYMGESILEDKTLSQQKRQKIKINRNQLLIDAEKIIREYKGYNGYIEFEYQDETGTGIGPTYEFYSLASKELKKIEGLWYKTSDFSLFPAPLDNFDNNQIEINIKLFTIMGFIIARGLYDDRLLDFPLNCLFWDLVLDRPTAYDKIDKIDKDLGKAITDFISIVRQKQKIKNVEIENDQTNLNDVIKYNNCKIEDIGLTFSLPGYNHIELKKGGIDELLNIYNIEEYLALIFDKLILSGTKKFIEAFKLGFNYVFPISSLKCFTSKELEEIICGCPSDTWEDNVLLENIIPSHGYDKNCSIFKGLIEIMKNMDNIDRKKFLLFVTGSPRLPLGGFKNLNPKLTVVKKKPEMGHENPDDYLPTVMTCQNFLKIPDYSNTTVLKDKLTLAINEGGNAFHLS